MAADQNNKSIALRMLAVSAPPPDGRRPHPTVGLDEEERCRRRPPRIESNRQACGGVRGGYHDTVSDATLGRHPRVRALRVAHVLVSGGLLLGSIVVAVLAHDIAAGLTCIGLMSLGDALGVLAAGNATPRNAEIAGAERKVLVRALGVTVALAVALLIASAGGIVPAATLVLPLLLAVATGALASAAYWRAGPAPG